MDFQYLQAEDLDRGWLNFEPDLPLTPQRNGNPNPFYVERPGNPFDQLQESLLAPFYQAPKFFFSGHRGCGKSTELRRLAVNPLVLARYYPVHFTIRDEADINNLDFKDLLLAIGTRLYQEYSERVREPSAQLISDLEAWRGKFAEEIERTETKTGPEFQGGVNVFFASAGLKMKMEPNTRRVYRQVIDHDITGLVKVINKISAAIQEHEGRPPLVLIDDLDKPCLETAKEIFHGNRETMLQLECAVVYTVSSPLFYSLEFEAIRDRAIFLPNIKLHAQHQIRPDRAGYQTMREFISRRINPRLIGPRAMNRAILISGGVFRELTRVMRTAIRYAHKSGRVELEHVRSAEAEIRGEYRRMLTVEQLATLSKIHQSNRLDDPDKAGPLLQMLAVLEYADNEPWWDIHPALISLLGGNGNGHAPDPFAA